MTDLNQSISNYFQKIGELMLQFQQLEVQYINAIELEKQKISNFEQLKDASE